MSFIRKIKDKLRANIIDSSKKKHPRTKEFHNLESSKSIGILFDTQNLDNYAYIKDIVKTLKSEGKNVQALGWVNDNKSPDYPTLGNISIYNNQQVNWKGISQEDYINSFIMQSFDILFVLTYSTCASIEYIKHVSIAKCKVGQHTNNADALDFIINLKDNQNVKVLFTESSKMLKQFSKAK